MYVHVMPWYIDMIDVYVHIFHYFVNTQAELMIWTQ